MVASSQISDIAAASSVWNVAALCCFSKCQSFCGLKDIFSSQTFQKQEAYNYIIITCKSNYDVINAVIQLHCSATEKSSFITKWITLQYITNAVNQRQCKEKAALTALCLCAQLHGKYHRGRPRARASTHGSHKTCTDELVKYLQCVIPRPCQPPQHCCQGNTGPLAKTLQFFCLVAFSTRPV